MTKLSRPLLAAAVAFVPATAFAQDNTAPFSLPELPYATDALEPVISAETMELHHGKHHQSYVDNLNKAVDAGDAPADASLEDIVASAGEYPTSVRNNAGGHWNHSFFWETMAPADQTGEASAELQSAIESAFGSMDEFKAAFEEAGTSQFGSGWAWLIINDSDELEITSTPNQDNPLMDVAEVQGEPLLGNDVWEHAYYLTYNNRRGEYLSAWWDVVNWDEVSNRYDEALASE